MIISNFYSALSIDQERYTLQLIYNYNYSQRYTRRTRVEATNNAAGVVRFDGEAWGEEMTRVSAEREEKKRLQALHCSSFSSPEHTPK